MQNGIENWDDLRFVLALRRAGTLLGAGRALGVATSTVGRRVAALESRLGVRLATRSASGLGLTSEGQRLAALAEEVEARVVAGGRDLGGADARVSGRVRVSAGDGFLPFLLGLAARFREAHPGVSLDVVAEAGLTDLARREADVGLRTMRPTAESLATRRLGGLGFGLYASEGYLRSRRPPTDEGDLAAHDFVGFEGPLARQPEMVWLRERGVRRFVVRSNLVAGVVGAALAGQGIAPLAHATAAPEVGLRRLLPGVELARKPVWLAMHRELRGVRRVRLFADALAAAFAAGA